MSLTTEDKTASVISSDKDKYSAWFIYTATAVLAVTGLAKMVAALGHSKLLSTPDPITGLPFGLLLLAAGILEFVISGVCFVSRSQKLALSLIAWLASGIAVYRIGLWAVGWSKPCSCLGNLTAALHISPQTGDNFMKIILAYLFIGSYGLLFLKRKQKQRALGKSHKIADCQ